MKTKSGFIVLFPSACILLLASAAFFIVQNNNIETKYFDTTNDSEDTISGIEYIDFEYAANKMISSLLNSGRLKKADGSRYVIATGRIINDTTQRIDTNQLIVKIVKEITDSGQAVFTDVARSGPESRALIAPELTIEGKIIQRNVPISSNRQKVEYFFQLELKENKTGLSLWQNELLVVKSGTNP